VGEQGSRAAAWRGGSKKETVDGPVRASYNRARRWIPAAETVGGKRRWRRGPDVGRAVWVPSFGQSG
jgi:hypothetical protein